MNQAQNQEFLQLNLTTSAHCIWCILREGFAKPGFLVKIEARGILKPQHIDYMRGF